MTQLIDKDALVAEIEKIRAKWFGINSNFSDGQKVALTKVLSLIDTLEVKEVDLEKEIEVWEDSFKHCPASMEYKETAKHFFELGLKTQKGE